MITLYVLLGIFALFWIAVYVNHQMVALREMIDEALGPEKDAPVAWANDDESWPA